MCLLQYRHMKAIHLTGCRVPYLQFAVSARIVLLPFQTETLLTTFRLGHLAFERNVGLGWTKTGNGADAKPTSDGTTQGQVNGSWRWSFGTQCSLPMLFLAWVANTKS